MTEKMTEAELAEYYDRTRDLSEFNEDDTVPVEVRRNVTISVRFSDEEIAQLRREADEQGVKVTAYIRDAALNAATPLDRSALRKASADIERIAHELGFIVERGSRRVKA